jgi:mannosyl-3-phosphoglycerate phosphatase family protein
VSQIKKILFTDLDGTLLDLHSYSADAAKPAVKALQDADVSIIFCSSKTWSEQHFYQRQLNISEPAIVENGSGIFILDENWKIIEKYGRNTIELHGQRVLALGKQYEDLIEVLKPVVEQYYPELKYYALLSTEEIAQITGLDPDSTQRAKRRDFSETIFNTDQQLESYKKLISEMERHGFHCIPGSKFVTITGVESDKGRAAGIVAEVYRDHYDSVMTFGVGDSLNDLAMLKAVDFPYLVQRPDRSWANIHINKLNKIDGVGPEGWTMVANEILAI